MRINSNDTSFKAYFKPNNQLKRIFSSKSAIDIIANHEIACPQTGIRSLRRKYPHQELEILDNYNIFNNTTGNLLQLSELNIDIIRQFPMDRLDEFKALPIAEDDTTITFILSNPFFVWSFIKS